MNIPEDLRSQIRMYTNWTQQMIQDYGDTMSEADVETKLVEPMLEILQWDPRSMEVKKRHPIKTKKGRYVADYALISKTKVRALIEVKKVANDLNDADVMQLMEYTFFEKADVSILTNGYEWRVYDPYHLRGMVFRFNLENVESNLGCLWLLSKDSIEANLLDQEIDRRYTIEKVYEHIKENRSNWISDIERRYKALNAESIGKILDKVIVGKSLVLGEVSWEGVQLPGRDDWLPPVDTQLASIAEDHTGKSISAFWFSGSTYEVNSWRELLMTLCSVILDKHRDEFDRVLAVKGQKRSYFTRDASILRSPRQIPDTDIFVETNMSAHNTTQVCRLLIAQFGYTDENLKVKAYNTGEMEEQADTDQYTVDWKFSGVYSSQRPIYNALESKVREFGDDVKINVRKAHTGFVRNQTFAVMHVRRDGIDIGLSLEPSVKHDRLREFDRWGGWSRMNRAILISKVEDIDDQLIGWIRQSYDRS